MKNKKPKLIIPIIVGVLILGLIVAGIFLFLSKEKEFVGLNIHYYKDGVEIFQGFISQVFVDPPGANYNQISFDVVGNNIGNVPITDLQIVDATPNEFLIALPTINQTLEVEDEGKILWSSEPMDAINFKLISPVNFWVKISGKDIYGNTVYGESYSGDITFGPDVEPYIIDGTTVTLCGDVEYDALIVRNGGKIKVCTSGILNLTATAYIEIDSTSSIDGSYVGYPGGASVRFYTANSLLHGISGTYTGKGGGGFASESARAQGVGCAGSGGGSAGHGGPGILGGHCYLLSWATVWGGTAGATYGDNTYNAEMGSGGGSGAASTGASGTGAISGAGGSGGGAIILNSNKITISGTISAIGASGGNGFNGAGMSCAGGGAGGSGGEIVLIGNTVNITNAILDVRGGKGGYGKRGVVNANVLAGGGAGAGGGRIKIFSNILYNEPSTLNLAGGTGGIGAGGTAGGNGNIGLVYYGGL